MIALSDAIFVDTNVFLRFFVADKKALYEKAKTLFAKAEAGEVKLITSEMVIAEIVWVLESYYGFLKKEIGEVINSLLHAGGLKVLNANLVGEAINVYIGNNVDFIDAYNSALIRKKGHTLVATFDRKHYQRLKGIKVLDW